MRKNKFIIFNLQHTTGFTLIEVLIVIGITVVVAAASVPLYGNLQASSQLNENSAQIIQVLRTARERSQVRFNNASHGVYFDLAGSTDRFIMYQGESYATRQSELDRITTLDRALQLSTTLSGTEVNFSRSLGQPNSIGTITLNHEVTGSRVININSLGSIEEE
jgi:prepilin-type N-terminal cleavage/methylation domain-containing protein